MAQNQNTMWASYAPIGRNSRGFREYAAFYQDTAGVSYGFQRVTAQRGQRGIDAVYAAAEARAKEHCLRLDRVALAASEGRR